MAEMDLGGSAGGVQTDAPGALSALFNWLGALMSVGLIAGLGIWGYQLAVRDVSGVPVIRALEGPARIAPEDPGGTRAAHQGLAVNSVAAEGGAAAPADRLILAPRPLDLSAEDLPRPMLDDAGEAVDVAAMTPALEPDAGTVEPLSAPIRVPEVSAAVIPASIAGVVRSPLPRPRPDGDLTASAVAASVAAAVSFAATEIDPASIPAGTRLVQFGAHDSAEAARSEWAVIADRFAEYMDGKDRVIERAVSGGKVFYRLRATGFADIADARRFCAALVAGKQACIPVVSR